MKICRCWPSSSLATALAITLATALAYAWLSARNDVLGNLSDGLIYLLMADVISPWRAAVDQFGFALFEQFSFPPLYPLALGLLGGGSEALVLSYYVNALSIGTMAGVLYLWYRRLFGTSGHALVLTGLFAVMPGSLLNGLGIQSEPLYMTLVFAALVALRASQQLVVVALLISACALTRSAGAALIVAALLVWLVQRPPRYKLAAVAMLVPLALWHLGRRLAGASSGYADQVFALSLNRLLELLSVNLNALGGAMVQNFDFNGGVYVIMICAPLGLLAVAVWIDRLRRLELDAVYLTIYLGILLLWPHPLHLPRLIYTVIPILLGYSFLGSRWLARRVNSEPVRVAVASSHLALCALVFAPSSVTVINQIAIGSSHLGYDLVRSQQWFRSASVDKARSAMVALVPMLESLNGIHEHLPDDACVVSSFTPYVMFHGRRRGRPLGPASDSDEALMAQFDDCPYVFMMALTQWPPTGHGSLYPYERIKSQLEVIEVKLWEPDAERGTVMTMLGRIKPAP